MNLLSEEKHLFEMNSILHNPITGTPHNDLPITTIKLEDGSFQVLSKYGDDEWILPNDIFVQNSSNHMKKLCFKKIPDRFVNILKIICFRYYMNGREGGVKPRGGTLVGFFKNARCFFDYLCEIKIYSLGNVTAEICAQYVQRCLSSTNKLTGNPLSSETLHSKFLALEIIHEKSQNTFDPMEHPWIDVSAGYLSGVKRSNQMPKTLVIPDEILSRIFRIAVDNLNESDVILNLCNSITEIYQKKSRCCAAVISVAASQFIKENGYDGLMSFKMKINRLLDSCMILILITSGIRVHELASLKNNCAYTSVGKEGEIYYWMSGRSDKTHIGNTNWLVTKLTHEAIKVAGCLTEFLYGNLKSSMMNVKSLAQSKHFLNCIDSLFITYIKGHIQCISSSRIRERLNQFSKYYDIDWHFSPHQFRRTFAVYAARSNYGDLRYLKKHFKHWSIDMTALYVLDEQQDAEIYDNIMQELKNEKISVVEHWLDESTLITGGMSEKIIAFRNKNEAVRTYKSRRLLAESVSENIYIRATTVGWCTADIGGCAGGQAIERTLCSGCENSVIDDRKRAVWEGIYNQQIELGKINDIGPAGKARVARDIQRCEYVLKELGMNLIDIKQEH